MKLSVSALLTVALAGLLSPALQAADPQTSFKFSFGPDKNVPGYTAVKPTDVYKKGAANAWGFEEAPVIKEVARKGADPLTSGFITSDKPFYFSVAVPEGNYKVTITAGDIGDTPTDLTVKAELRRLMIEHFHLDAGKTGKTSIVVNVRVPAYPGGRVGLKQPRETTNEAWAWDEKLTLELNNAHQNICAIEVEKVDVPTIFILGDSTTCDQSAEPWSSWGQTFPRFFKDDIAVSNNGESGESVASSLGARRFEKVWSLMKKGDYLFFVYGHNDMKGGSIAAFQNNYRKVVETTRAKGGIPVILSAVERKGGVEKSTLAGYPEAAKAVADETKTLFIDMNGESRKLYKALGPDLNAIFQDGTHHNNIGSYEISQIVMQGIRDNKIDDLIAHFRPEVKPFDPTKPDKVADYKIPASPKFSSQTPLGS